MSTQVATILQKDAPFLVGEWLVEPTLNRLSREGVSVQLELKAIDVLLCLIQHAGEVVSKDMLFDTVWQTEFVSDSTITSRIRELRSAFGDDAQNPRYIETIRKRGYRLIAEVRAAPAAEEAAPQIPEAPPSPDDEHNPYPGLAAFTEADADRFYGREAEAAALWRKISARRLLAVIGPSGVGKSSLLRAGVVPRAPPGWRVVVLTPGEAPALSLARALAPDHTADPAAMARLLGFSDADTALAVVSRWRGQFKEAVLVVDQFEELFTLNPPEAQASFIELLRRLVDAADVHVVLGMRDDYLYRCNEYPVIAPIFDALTPLSPPTPEGLRRALKEPAGRQLYRFETELLVDRMIAEVEGGLGALPLMAFAVHRLWEKRDLEEQVLTEDAYERIGGVAGALARHADATLESIGVKRLPIVRELFRNLVTAEGTRAVREVDDLLSVFPKWQRESAEEALGELTDARLLTGYRTHGDDEQPKRRVEIIHESLLTSWPRLVRWQTQDADSARLRDELRQAARMWDDHDRANDYLWTGRAFREFAVWSENYPGGLSSLEEEFAGAMTSHATRRRRWRRIAVSAVIALLLLVLGIVAASRQQAVAEARRAEASRLVALGQLQLEDYPTATLAHAIASLELADSQEARRLALGALWRGPTGYLASPVNSWDVTFSPDNRWLVRAKTNESSGVNRLRIFDVRGTSESPGVAHPGATGVKLAMAPGSRHFISYGYGDDSTLEHILWSIEDRRRLSDIRYELPAHTQGIAGDEERGRIVLLVSEVDRFLVDALEYTGSITRLGEVNFQSHSVDQWGRLLTLGGRHGGVLAAVVNGEVQTIKVGQKGLSDPRRLGAVRGKVVEVAIDPLGRFVATAEASGPIRLWNLSDEQPPVVLRGPSNPGVLRVTPDGTLLEAANQADEEWVSWVWDLSSYPPFLMGRINVGTESRGSWRWDTVRRQVASWGPNRKVRLRSMKTPSDAEALVLSRAHGAQINSVGFSPDGLWLACADLQGVSAWPLHRPFAHVFRHEGGNVRGLVFAPNGEWLASSSSGGARIRTLGGEPSTPGRVLLEPDRDPMSLAVSSDGNHLLASSGRGTVYLLRPDGVGPRILEGFTGQTHGVAFSPDGRLAAAAGGRFDPAERVIRLWDVASGKEAIVLEVGEAVKASNLQFTSGGYLYSGVDTGLLRWDVNRGTREHVHEGQLASFSADSSGRWVIMMKYNDKSSMDAYLLDVESGEAKRLHAFGDDVETATIDSRGTFGVAGTYNGEVRVGRLDGEEPHLLLGHTGAVTSVAIDPRGRWIASGSLDNSVRIWPTPDLSKPPLHTLPHDELLAKLKNLTNLRVVRDEESATGWTLTHEAFPGWETVPTW